MHTTNRYIQPTKFTARNGGVSVKVGNSGAASSSMPHLTPTPGIGASRGAQGSAARNVACPVCGGCRFKSTAGVVQYVESRNAFDALRFSGKGGLVPGPSRQPKPSPLSSPPPSPLSPSWPSAALYSPPPRRRTKKNEDHWLVIGTRTVSETSAV